MEACPTQQCEPRFTAISTVEEQVLHHLRAQGTLVIGLKLMSLPPFNDPATIQYNEPKGQLTYTGGTSVLQRVLVHGMPHWPWKKALYVNDIEYCWCEDNFQMNMSGLVESNWNSSRCVQREMYCLSTERDSEPEMSRIHWEFCKVSAKTCVFLAHFGTASTTSGANDVMESLSNQWSD
jgi:hypothetical protein